MMTLTTAELSSAFTCTSCTVASLYSHLWTKTRVHTPGRKQKRTVKEKPLSPQLRRAEVDFEVQNMFPCRVDDLFFHGFLQLIQSPTFQSRCGQRTRFCKLIADRGKEQKLFIMSHSLDTVKLSIF